MIRDVNEKDWKIAKERSGNWQNTTLFELRLESKVEKSANYFKNGFL